MNKFRKIILPISVLVLIAVLAGISFANSQSGKSAVELISPQKGNIAEELHLTGKVQSENTFDLGFERYGKVAGVYVSVGDKVKKGQLLAELSAEDASISYAQALSDQAIAAAELEKAKEDKAAQQAKLKSVEKSSSANKYDEKAQKQAVDEAEATIKSKEASFGKMNEAVQSSKVQAGKTKLYAPEDGVVTKQLLQDGEVVSAYAPVISLIGDEVLQIQSYVSEVELKKISVGDVAKVEIDNQEGNMEATVFSIDPVETSVSSVSSYKVVFVPNSASDNIKSGMEVDLKLDLGEKKETLIIPQQSVFEEGGKSFVLVASGDDRIKKEVTLGVKNLSGEVEVLSGINEQDEIVSFNQSR